MTAPSAIDAVRNYVSRFVSDVKGMKAVLMDQDTTSIVSLCYSQSEIIAHEVFLVERIDDAGGSSESKDQVSMHHLKAVVFLRPTARSVAALKRQLKKPKYREYHVFFSNILREDFLRELAEADELDVIKQVQEFYADFMAVNPELWHLNIPHTRMLAQPDNYWSVRERRVFKRHVEGVLSVLLSFKKRPLVRYDRSSALCEKLAKAIAHTMSDESELFHFQRSATTPILLVLDRREDPVTPLLLQWTYQAMVHELLTIKNNRVDLRDVPNVPAEMREVVLSSNQDHFFKGSMLLNFGDLGASVKGLLQDFARKKASNKQLETVEDMQRFVDQYPEYKQMHGNVTKHVTVTGELSRLVGERSLLDQSAMEQDLVCQSDHSSSLSSVMDALDNPKLTAEDRLRVVCLYALKYEQKTSQIEELKRLLTDRATTPAARARVRVVDELLSYAGTGMRGGDLFGNKTLMKKMSRFLSMGVKEMENVYTQHKPVLASILDQLIKSKLRTSAFPFAEPADGDGKERVQDVFVFIAGGVTFEEHVLVSTLNQSGQGLNISLGGSFVHNSASFMDDVLSTSRGFDDGDEKGDFR